MSFVCNETATPKIYTLSLHDALPICLVILYVKDGVQLGDLQQVVNLLGELEEFELAALVADGGERADQLTDTRAVDIVDVARSEEHTSELQSRGHLVCRLLLEKKN